MLPGLNFAFAYSSHLQPFEELGYVDSGFSINLAVFEREEPSELNFLGAVSNLRKMVGTQGSGRVCLSELLSLCSFLLFTCSNTELHIAGCLPL